jgi:ACS family hexuronate transporter-like MFS transporter
MLAPPLVAFFAIHFGWRWGFITTGAVGFVLLAIWWRTYDSPEKHSRLTETERTYIVRSMPKAGPVAKRIPMATLLLQPVCLGFFLARLLTDSSTYFFSFWLPDYLTQARGFTLAMIGLVGWLPFLAADIGGPGGGALSDWLVRRGWKSTKARRLLMGCAAGLMPLAAVAVRCESVWGAIALIAVLLAAQSCWMANQLTLISESVSRENVATLLALSALGGSLGGIVTTLLTGRVIASYGYVPVFTTLGCLHLSAFGILLLCNRIQDRRTAAIAT